jgi:PAS domain S-box-containing protein
MDPLPKVQSDSQPHDLKEAPHSPITRLCRTYCVLGAGAALFILIGVGLNSLLLKKIALSHAELFVEAFSSSLYLNRFNLILNWLGFLLLAGAIFYGFKIARQAGIDARKNERLLQEAKQRTLEIAALYDTSQEVAVQHNLSALLQTILERANTLLSAAGSAIFLYDAEHDDYQIAVEFGVGMPIGTHLSPHEGLAGRVHETREPVIVNDYPNWPYRSKALRQLPITAVVCVPMIRQNELMGVLGVHEVGKTNRIFTDADARLLSLFAANAASAVYNARLLEDLRNSEERFRIAAECASDLVYDWDLLKEHVDYFGELFERIRATGGALAQTRAEYWDSIHPDDRERIQKAFNDHLETGGRFSEEYRVSVGKGSYGNVADRGTAIRNKKGKPVRLIGTVSDITERKRAEQMKTDFVSFVTHQLRTPLSGVKWLLELAKDATDNPAEMLSFVEDARISTNRLIRLVNDLLDSSRLERGKLKIVCQHVDVADLTQNVVREMMPLLSEKEEVLNVWAAEDLPKPFVDTQLLRQAILNLISNAMKYTPAKGEIQIHIAGEKDCLRWEIKDTGIGIPKADLGRLFQKFYRAGNAVAVETEGTGLGLYLVRLIIERFGGKIWCESEEGIGSTFTFTLPCAANEVSNE